MSYKWVILLNISVDSSRYRSIGKHYFHQILFANLLINEKQIQIMTKCLETIWLLFFEREKKFSEKKRVRLKTCTNAKQNKQYLQKWIFSHCLRHTLYSSTVCLLKLTKNKLNWCLKRILNLKLSLTWFSIRNHNKNISKDESSMKTKLKKEKEKRAQIIWLSRFSHLCDLFIFIKTHQGKSLQSEIKTFNMTIGIIKNNKSFQRMILKKKAFHRKFSELNLSA